MQLRLNAMIAAKGNQMSVDVEAGANYSLFGLMEAFGALCRHIHMKTNLPLTLILVTFSVSLACSQEIPQPPPMISVSGSAEVKVAPDEIYLRMGVETRHANLEEAKRLNDSGVSKALAFLKGSNVKGND